MGLRSLKRRARRRRARDRARQQPAVRNARLIEEAFQEWLINYKKQVREQG